MLVLLVSSLVCLADSSTFRFASYYADHMVLQREPSKAVIWGYGEVGAVVTVSLYQGSEAISKNTVEINGVAGVWKVLLDPVKPGGHYWLLAEQHYQKNVTSIKLHDLLFGDVWLCGGQSNMEMTVSQVFNASKELATASKYPHIRLFAAALDQSDTPLDDLAKIDLQWSVPTPENLGNGDFTYFSAVCWMFGRHLARRLKYPIGLVESVWGGTPVEAWSSERALKKCGLSDEKRIDYREDGPCSYKVLWNAMIHPLLNMTIKGAIWYQGEQNTVTNPNLYNCTFPALIEDWRTSFYEGTDGQTDRYFPFGFVQLSTYQKSTQKDMFPVIRWHQTADYGYAPNPKMKNTFMAVAMDLGDETSPYGCVHPRDKQTVAYRLFLGARAVAYGEKNITFQGPFPKRIDVFYKQSYINITYDQQLLITHLSEDIFEVLCEKRISEYEEYVSKWVSAATYSESFSNVVSVTFKGCSHVLGIRYAWADWPCEYKDCPIYSIHGKLPAPLFVQYFQ
ncbi:sialate O-acetylesterase [Rhinophrynus dorsalis]